MDFVEAKALCDPLIGEFASAYGWPLNDPRLDDLTELDILEDRLNRLITVIERENARLAHEEKPSVFDDYEQRQRANELERRAGDETERKQLNDELFSELMSQMEVVKREHRED